MLFTRWTRGLIQQLFAISRDLWGYRCSILHAENKETLDKLYQNELWEMHQDLRSDWWRFGPKDLQIIGDGEVVFSEGIIPCGWHVATTIAQESAFFQATDKVHDICTYFAVRKSKSTHREVTKSVTSIIPTQVLYRQTKLATYLLPTFPCSDEPGDELLVSSPN